MAFIVLAAGHDALGRSSRRRSRRSCASACPPTPIPRMIEFVPDLPKTLTGKIRRIELRERARGADGDGTRRPPT